MNELVTEALVLRTFRVGEADRSVVLWTPEHGRVRAIARGARRTTSRLGGVLEVTADVTVDLVRGRGDRYVVRHVTHRSRRAVLRGDFERLGAGLLVVEALDALPFEGPADPAIFALGRRVLDTLDDPQYRPDLVPAAFYWRLLSLDGSEPVLDQCAECGRAGPLVAFDAASGGGLCAACRHGASISPEALALLRRIAGGDLATVLREVGTPATAEVAALVHGAMEAHLGRRLRGALIVPPEVADR